jgi:hypothetical protein
VDRHHQPIRGQEAEMTKIADRICATCEYRVPTYNGSGYSYCNGPQRERYSRIRGLYQDPATTEYERAWLWRRLGFNTCGPDGNYWFPTRGLGTPPSAIDE